MSGAGLRAGTTDERGEFVDRIRRELAEAVAKGGSQDLFKLTDEELVVLDPTPDDKRLVATPHLDSLAGSQRQVAIATAIRTLIARDVARVTNAGQLDEAMRSASGDQQVEVTLRSSGLVQLVLALRGTAGHLVTVELHAAAGDAYGYFYVHEPGLILREHVNSGGMHMYSVVKPDDMLAAARDLLDPLGIAGIAVEDGQETRLDSAGLERREGGPLNAVIGAAVSAGRMHCLSAAGVAGPLLLTYGTKAELWTVWVERPGASSEVTAQAVNAETLGEYMARFLRLTGISDGR